jgi:hypothetical protein
MIQLNTKASGNFKVCVPDHNGELKTIVDTKNMIVNSGLEKVATTTWADCLKTVLAGTSDADEQAGQLDLVARVAGMDSNEQPANPASYTLTSYSSVGPNPTGVVFRLGKTFTLRNTTGVSQTIKELGISSSAPGTANPELFSRVKLTTPFTLENGKFAYIIYELELTTGVSTTRQVFQVTTDGTPGYLFPTNSDLGLFNCPFAYLESNGTVTNKSFTTGHALFEPSIPTCYLYKIKTQPAAGYFTSKRDSFEANLLNPINASTIADPTYDVYASTGNAFENEVYTPSSYRKVRHIIVSPETPSLPEDIYGFSISGKSTAAGQADIGLQCIFSSAWPRPYDAFLKLHFEQNWNRA